MNPTFQGVNYKNIFYQIEGIQDVDGTILIRNYPFTPNALNIEKKPESEIKLFLCESYYLDKKRKQIPYRYGYLAHFFYLGGTNAEIDKKMLFKTICPNAIFTSESEFVRNTMDLLSAIAVFYKMQSIALQDEATNKNGFPLCENRFRRPTYIGTYEKYGFIQDKILYGDDGNKGNRKPATYKTAQQAVADGNREINDDYLSAQEHFTKKEIEQSRKRDFGSDLTIKKIVKVPNEKTLEQLVSDYYTKLSMHQVPIPELPYPCFGGRVKYIDYLPNNIVQMVAFKDDPSSLHFPTGAFYLEQKQFLFSLESNELSISNGN